MLGGGTRERTDGRQCGAVQRRGERTGLQEESPQAKAPTVLRGKLSVMVMMVH